MSAQQTYPVSCACGKVHEMSAGAAGSSFACECGRTVEVPSLVKLRASVGQSGLSVDFELDQVLRTNTLPTEDTCGVCGERTRHVCYSTVACERAKRHHDPLLAIATSLLLTLLTCGLLLVIVRRVPGKIVGRDVVYHLPIRVCESCAGEKWTVDVTRSVLKRTPLYTRLLNKYPKAEVRLPVPLHE